MGHPRPSRGPLVRHRIAAVRSVEAWARERGRRTLKVETQNTNVPACRFYRRMGCALGAIDLFAYAHLPDEVQLMWFKEL